jgi:hypothetical protein
VWPTLFSKVTRNHYVQSSREEELQHLLEEGLRRPGTNGNKEMLFALAAELREGRLVTYSSTALKFGCSRWRGPEGGQRRPSAGNSFRGVHGDLRSAYLWTLRYKGSGESEYSAWQAQGKRQELAAGLSSGERARVERLADNRSIVTVSAGE